MIAPVASPADILTLPLFAWGARMPKRRTDGRFHDTGLIRPYRPCPPDFRERFLEMGQSKELQEHYRTNWRCIARWIDEAGGDVLRAERYALSGGFARPNKRSRSRPSRFVLGRTLTAVSRPRAGK